MFALGFIFMVNDSQELSVIFVPLVLSELTPMVEVFPFYPWTDLVLLPCCSDH